MTGIDFSALRRSLSALPSDHDASGEHRPTVGEIFAPAQHANALDPNTPVIVGARGSGKSFWAGVLEQDDTRAATAVAYPNLGLEKLIVRAGYTGFPTDGGATAKIIEARVPEGKETRVGVDFWQAVMLRVARSALDPENQVVSIRDLMEKFEDPEDFEKELKAIDSRLVAMGRVLLVTFDALDTLSREWVRSSLLVDALFEAVWGLRARKAIRAKIFIRPEQLNDESLRFVEISKLRSGRVELEWTQTDLYGLLFWRLSEDPTLGSNFKNLAIEVGSPIPSEIGPRRRRWSLLNDRDVQKKMMERFAGPYMGRGYKKGGTYDWPYRHLGDATGQVTPRSFLKLFVEAAKFGEAPANQVIVAEGIRHGLREASKVRVDQLGIEYKWVRRALAPLAGLTVPCSSEEVFARWSETNTVQVILRASRDKELGFLPPFPTRSKGNRLELLAGAMERIGLIAYRTKERIDIPDLFRVAALMLKKGGTPPKQKNKKSKAK